MKTAELVKQIHEITRKSTIDLTDVDWLQARQFFPFYSQRIGNQRLRLTSLIRENISRDLLSRF